MVSHFLFEAEFCNPASGWEKGQIEKNVQDARHRLLVAHAALPLSRRAERTGWRRDAYERWALTPHGLEAGTVADVRAEEAQHLMPLSRTFDGFVEYAKRVSTGACLVHLDRNRYSVPGQSFANRPVSVRVYPERIVVAAEGQVVCVNIAAFLPAPTNARVRPPFSTGRHYLAVIQRKPERPA